METMPNAVLKHKKTGNYKRKLYIFYTVYAKCSFALFCNSVLHIFTMLSLGNKGIYYTSHFTK